MNVPSDIYEVHRFICFESKKKKVFEIRRIKEKQVIMEGTIIIFTLLMHYFSINDGKSIIFVLM